MDASENREFAYISHDLAVGDHFMDLVEHGLNFSLGLALYIFRQERGGGFGDTRTGTERTDVFDSIAVQFQKEFELISTERVVALGGTGRRTQLMEIARVLAVIEDHLLIKFAQVVEHGLTPFSHMRVGFQPFPNDAVQFCTSSRVAHTFDDLSGKGMNEHLASRS